MNQEKLIEVENVSKKIKDTYVLKDISLKFESGKIYALCGHNGSGKTMLLRTIAGLIRPTSGKVMIFKKELHKDMDFPDSIGVLIENTNFWSAYTGKEVLEALASIRKIATKEDIEESLLRVGLDPQNKKAVGKYSLGMRQRLAIAQAIMEKPDILLLDEPTNALDKEGVQQIHAILESEKKRGAIIIIASHNESDLEFCDQIFHISGGTLV